MNRLLLYIFLNLGLNTIGQCYSQHNNINEVVYTDKQTANPQLTRIMQRLQQHQAALNESAVYPGSKQIQKDLIGHSLAEGVESGSNNIDDVGWYNANSGNKTHPVGTQLPNELGFYDMTGMYGNFALIHFATTPIIAIAQSMKVTSLLIQK